MKKSFTKRVLIAAAVACMFANPIVTSAEYANLNDAISDVTTPREYVLPATENVIAPLGAMGGTIATLTIDGSSSKYGINGDNVAGLTVGAGNSLILQNIGSVTVSGDGTAVSDYTVNNSINGFSPTTSGGFGFVRNSGTLTISDTVFNDNKAPYNNSNGNGGAISNTGATANITEISNVTFIGNRADYGAAISNTSGAKIGNITADFINNTGGTGHSYGAAIYNTTNSEIGNIQGKFVGNSLNASFYAVGVGIYNDNATIGNVAGEFYNNTVSGDSVMGSVIFNDSGAEIGNISGTFENTTVTSGSYILGGVINNGYTGYSTIGDVSADFKNNTITANGAYGYIIGAIIETGDGNDGTGSKLGNITGNFENNTASGDYGVYGGIYNDANATIGDITGTFKDNTLSGGTVYGLITNDGGTINKIEGATFENNATNANGSDGLGGAIVNAGTITYGIINSKFTDNHATSVSSAAQGGAIYTENSLSIIADGSVGDGISTFQGNYTQVGTGAKRYEAIGVSGAGNTLTLESKNGGTLNLYDYITGSAGYTTKLTGDSDSTINLYNDIKNSNVEAENVNINLANDTIHEYEVKTLTSDASANWTIDLDFQDASNLKADTIKTAEASTGTVTLNGFNILGDTSSITGTDKIQILKTQSDSLQLALSDAAKRIVDRTTVTIIDDVVANNTWATEYYSHITNTDKVLTFSLATTDTTYDSIGFVSSEETSSEDISLGDTLVLVNQADIAERNFTTSNATDVYDVSSNLGEAAEGTFTVSGTTSGSDISTINLGDYKGFELSNVTTLNLDNVKINGNDIITVTNNAAKVNLTDAVINGDIKGTTPFDIVTGGNTELNGNTTNVKLTNNGNLINGGTISGDINNKSGAKLTTKIEGLNGDVTNDGAIYFTNAGNTKYDIKGNGDIHLSDTGTTVLNHKVNGNTLHLDKGSNLEFGKITDISQGGLVANGGSISGIMDNKIGSYNLGNVKLNNDLTFNGIDFRLSDLKSDRLSGNYSGSGKVIIDNINIIGSKTTRDFIRVKLSDVIGIDDKHLNVKAQKLNDIMTPIKRLTGSVENNYLTYQAGNGVDSFNPAVFASPVAAQVGGFLTQAQTLHEGFYHLDRYSKLSRNEKIAASNTNKYTISDVKSIPTYMRNTVPEEDYGMWVTPYTSFESVNLKGGIKVNNITYGALYGGDSDLRDLGNGYKGVISAFVGYNGSHQTYDGISMNQQGGSLGLTGTLYKGNFFTALTASAGASAGEAYTSYGRDHFSMLTAGVANRTGYNWELAGGKLIIQPQVFLGYIFVNPFDYTSSSGVRISSDPLNTIQVAPGLKVIGNTKNGWRPYASVDVMMNFMGHTKYRADETRLPELSVKPYVQYGVGVQKSWGERFTGFLQAMLRNGGRNGIVLSAGFRWAIGRDNSKNVNAAPKQKIVIKQLNRNGVKICKTGI